MATQPAAITVESVTLAFDHDVVQHDVSFDVQHGEIFVIMGASGSGKSTLLRSMIGLLRPATGQISFDGKPLWTATDDQCSEVRRRCGILFQSGALWSSLTLAENVGLPLSQFTTLRPSEIAEVVSLKLALVGLAGFERYYPSEISGGMKKRAGLARAIALDPDILFFDEPSAGLDPLSAKRLDDLILELRDGLGATVVLVTHDLDSILTIADNAVFLDAGTHTAIEHGNPKLLQTGENATVRAFLTRGHARSRADVAFGAEEQA
jgi:phospholipid/cholesterol/gamma-HCH transport system ATP-binding protein